MKQKNIPWIGAFMESFFMTLPVFSIFSTIAIIIVLYANIQPYLIRYIPWMNLWAFMGILMTFGLTGMFLMYKFVLRSIWDFRGKQTNGNKPDTNEIDGRLDRIEKTLVELAKLKKENG
jgi:hypothetical protein